MKYAPLILIALTGCTLYFDGDDGYDDDVTDSDDQPPPSSRPRDVRITWPTASCTSSQRLLFETTTTGVVGPAACADGEYVIPNVPVSVTEVRSWTSNHDGSPCDSTSLHSISANGAVRMTSSAIEGSSYCGL